MKNYSTFKTIFLFLILFLLKNIIFAQSGLEYQVIHLENTKDFFIKWEAHPDYPISDIYIDGNQILSRDYTNTSILIRNIPVTHAPNLEIKYLNTEGTEGVSQSFPLYEKEEGVLEVTDAIYNILEPWTDTEESIIDLLINQESVTDPEIYALLQQFFNISPQDMSNLLGNNSIYPSFKANPNLWRNLIITIGERRTGECICKL